MQVTDQIAALRALGTDPIRKLVVPRVLAGLLMMPLLSILATGIGMVGGWIVTVLQFHVASTVYWSSVVQGLLHPGRVDGADQAGVPRVHHRDDRLPRRAADDRRHAGRRQLDEAGGRGELGGGHRRGLHGHQDS